MMRERMLPLSIASMTERQRAAADELTAGPRKGVKGPFIALLRSPELMARLQMVGEYLRFDSVLLPRLSEFATLIVAREWTQQFEWATHVPLALKAGCAPETVAVLAEGRRPDRMSRDEAIVYDFAIELARHRGVADATYDAARGAFGEQGIVDLVAILGYFATVSMILNVAQTPVEHGGEVDPLPTLPQ